MNNKLQILNKTFDNKKVRTFGILMKKNTILVS